MYPVNKGARCVKWQRVGRSLLRCARFDYLRRPGWGFPRGHIPANRGAKCQRRQRVFSPWLNKKVWRCASYGRGSFVPRMSSSAVSRSAYIPTTTSRKVIVDVRTRDPYGYVPMSLPAFSRASMPLLGRGASGSAGAFILPSSPRAPSGSGGARALLPAPRLPSLNVLRGGWQPPAYEPIYATVAARRSTPPAPLLLPSVGKKMATKRTRRKKK